MDIRYPVGPYKKETEMTQTMIDNWITDIEHTPNNLRKAVEGLGQDQLDTPYREGGWTVRQVVHQLADSHLNSYVRLKLVLTEEKPVVKPYDEGKWAELSDSTLPVEISLNMLEAIHQRWVHLLRQLTLADLEKSYIHPESGETALKDFIGLYAWHGRHHVAHITALRKRENW
jgi:hypothetical protein